METMGVQTMTPEERANEVREAAFDAAFRAPTEKAKERYRKAARQIPPGSIILKPDEIERVHGAVENIIAFTRMALGGVQMEAFDFPEWDEVRFALLGGAA